MVLLLSVIFNYFIKQLLGMLLIVEDTAVNKMDLLSALTESTSYLIRCKINAWMLDMKSDNKESCE